MQIHKEGRKIVIFTAIFMMACAGAAIVLFPPSSWQLYLILALLLSFFSGIVYFFRSPARRIKKDREVVYSPADGRVVVVEQTTEKEVFDQPMKQVSVFMWPLNVHLNRFPTDGKVSRYVYHPGKYLVAWHPKSSQLNERNTIVIETPQGIRYMLRQIAGVLARRIICYCREGMEVRQGEELGFIKFGSRVDLFLPADAQILVKPGDRVKGGLSVLARFNEAHQSDS